MKWAAFVTIGIGTALAGIASGPLWIAPYGDSYDPYSPLVPNLWEIFLIGLLLVPIFLVSGLVSLLFMRLSLAGRRHEIATRMALGEQRSAMLRAASGQGAVLGMIAAGVGLVVGTIAAHLVYEQASFGDGELSVAALLIKLITFAVAVVTATLANVIAIAAVTRGTPDDMDAAAFAPDAQSKPRSRRRLVLASVGWSAYAAALLVATVNRLVPLDNWALLHLGDPGWLMVVKNIALAVALFGTLWAIYLVTRALAVRGLAALASLLRRSDPRGARSLAADGLLRPSPSRTQVLSLSAIISLLVTASIAGVGHANALAAAGTDANPDSFLFAVSVLDEATQPAGFASTPLDPGALAALTADPRVDVVPLSVLYGETFDYESIDGDVSETGTDQALTMAIDVEASDAVAPDALRALGMTDGVVLVGQDSVLDGSQFGAGGYEGVSELSVDGGVTSTYGVSTPLQFTAIDRDWASRVWGSAPISGAGLFLSDGLPEQPSAADIAREYFPEGTAWTYEADGYGWETIYGGSDLVMVAIGLGLAVVLIVSATVTSVKLRRRDLATFAALGASPSALRAAPVWEASALAASSYFAGAIVGVATSVVTTNVFLLKPGAPTKLSEIMWHLWSDLLAKPWGWIVVAGAVTIGAAGLAAAVFGSSMAGRSPVEELRTADKEGVR